VVEVVVFLVECVVVIVVVEGRMLLFEMAMGLLLLLFLLSWCLQTMR